MLDDPGSWTEAVGVELRQLEDFVAVVDEGSITRAAARLHMVQSSLSASLLALEKELGADLFIRGRQGAGLTDAGRAPLQPARAALHGARGVETLPQLTALSAGGGLRQDLRCPPPPPSPAPTGGCAFRSPEGRARVRRWAG
ncbi:LysR family transcriptional regulator [Geodermatophilus sp. SYSU D00691]